MVDMHSLDAFSHSRFAGVLLSIHQQMVPLRIGQRRRFVRIMSAAEQQPRVDRPDSRASGHRACNHGAGAAPPGQQPLRLKHRVRVQNRMARDA